MTVDDSIEPRVEYMNSFVCAALGLAATASIANAEPFELNDAQMRKVTAGLFDNAAAVSFFIPISLDLAANSPVTLNLTLVIQTTVINSTAVALAYGVLTPNARPIAVSQLFGGLSQVLRQR